MATWEFRFRRNARFVVFRSAGEIGIDVFLRERHKPVLLSKEIVEPSVHRYVQYTQRGRVEEYVQRRERDASDFNEVVHIKGPREEPVTLLSLAGKPFGQLCSQVRQVQHANCFRRGLRKDE